MEALILQKAALAILVDEMDWPRWARWLPSDHSLCHQKDAHSKPRDSNHPSIPVSGPECKPKLNYCLLKRTEFFGFV